MIASVRAEVYDHVARDNAVPSAAALVFRATVRNTSPDSQQASISGFDPLIVDQDGKTVWHPFDGWVMASGTFLRLAAGDSRLFRAVWNGRTNASAEVAPEIYRVTARLLGLSGNVLAEAESTNHLDVTARGDSTLR